MGLIRLPSLVIFSVPQLREVRLPYIQAAYMPWNVIYSFVLVS